MAGPQVAPGLVPKDTTDFTKEGPVLPLARAGWGPLGGQGMNGNGALLPDLPGVFEHLLTIQMSKCRFLA